MLTKQDDSSGLEALQIENTIILSLPKTIQTYLFYYPSITSHKKHFYPSRPNPHFNQVITLFINNKLQKFYKNLIDVEKCSS